jgi:hypothetical protein
MRNLILLAFTLMSFSVLYGQENRTLTGEGNNFNNPEWGAANSEVLRQTTVNYADGISIINDSNLPMPRILSNNIFDQPNTDFDNNNLSDYVWVFGQFIDHDVTLVESDNTEPIFLEIPTDDQFFSPSEFIVTARNEAREGSGTDINNPRQYTNHISSFIDASAVYGSDQERADWLRDFQGDGKLKVSEGDLLPWNTTNGELSGDIDASAPAMADDTRSLSKFYVAGDVRANENPLLIGMHTLFVREHNRLCDELRADNPNWSGERIYQRARKFVGAYIQNIVYDEWLPSMGVVVTDYSGYRDDVNPTISNVFSAAAFRLGHTLINSNIIRMDYNGDEISDGNILLKDAFFNPLAIEIAGGVDPYFKGMGTQIMQKMDSRVISDIRNFLFGSPGSGGLDLASINIFRGRDRGLSDFNTIRDDFGLPKVSSFSDFLGTAEEVEIYSNNYNSVDEIDAWVGMLGEKHMPGKIFGELIVRILEDQFQRLRDGDRFYFENDPVFTESDIAAIKEVNLHYILMRNSDIEAMQKDLFFAMPHEDIPTGPEIGTDPLSVVAYPNPVDNFTNIKVFSTEEQTAELKVFNTYGQLVQVRTVNLLPGDNNLVLDFNGEYDTGIYNVLITAGDDFNILKLIKE